MKRYVGQSEARLDGVWKATGAAGYTHDVTLPNMLYAKILRSSHAHANILSLDASEAEALPGVRAVAHWENTPRVLYNGSAFAVTAASHFTPILDQYVFDNKVRFVGDEVAAVAADTEAAAEEACRRIRVSYEVLPAVSDPLEALGEDAAAIHEDQGWGKNMLHAPTEAGVGDFEAAWAECDVTYEGTVKLPVQKQVPMETSSSVAQTLPGGGLRVWSSSQTPHQVRVLLANVLDIAESKVQVICPPFIGGGFGQRSGMSGKAEMIAAVLALKTGRPVKLEYDRHEEMTATDSRHGGYVNVRLGAKKDGTFHALSLDPVLNTGAYCSWGGTMSMKIYTFGATVYRVPNTRHFGKTVYTNILPAGAMRGFGNPQAMFAVETAVDAIARKLGRDPIDLRMQNIVAVGDDWDNPFECVSTELAACVRRAADAIGWAEKRGRKQEGTLRRGVGIAVGRHVSASDRASGVFLRLEADGSLYMTSGVCDMGNGITTTLPQILAESLSIPLERINMYAGDTNATPYDIGGHSTRSLYDRGLAVINAADQLRQNLLEYAAEVWGEKSAALRYEAGVIRGAQNSWTLEELALYAHRHQRRFEVIGRGRDSTTAPWEAHAAEVEVDMETGVVKVIKVAAAHDVGVAINPALVEGQIEGGVLQGIGYALREEITFDENCVPYNDSIHKYMLPTAGDVPVIESIIVEANDPLGPFGAKGVAECSVVPTAPAIVSAVEDATGIRFLELPLTPVRVLQGINEARASQ